ncbi:MAG: hypothetical protein QF893_13100 [Alphaproteobacteria bacterium]|nr:hypothetical protein [Alphaproteobacteria bacterium]
MSRLAPGALWLLTPTAERRDGGWIDDVLAQRVAERGLDARLDQVGRFPRQRVEVLRGDEPERRVNELYYRRGWTDGLPVVPPTLGRVEAMLRQTARPATQVIAPLEPLLGLATVEKVAANAVMAGCLPAHSPVVLAAVEAIAEPEFNLRGVQTTDENVTPLVIVSGPLAAALDINASFGALGPGWRANAAIGRALRLVMHNIGGGWPAVVAFAGLGQPGRYTLCFAEDEATNPWPSLREELGFGAEESVVVVSRAETAINVTGGLDDLASVMGSAASAFSMLHDGKVTVVLAPFVAAELAKQGWDKAAAKQYLHDKGRMSAEAWRRTWLHQRLIEADRWPDWVLNAAEEGAIPAVAGPDDITIVVAGGDIPIPQCAYFPSWGFPPARVAKRIEASADGLDDRS